MAYNKRLHQNLPRTLWIAILKVSLARGKSGEAQAVTANNEILSKRYCIAFKM